jgi:hypothetical protein
VFVLRTILQRRTKILRIRRSLDGCHFVVAGTIAMARLEGPKLFARGRPRERFAIARKSVSCRLHVRKQGIGSIITTTKAPRASPAQRLTGNAATAETRAEDERDDGLVELMISPSGAVTPEKGCPRRASIHNVELNVRFFLFVKGSVLERS